MDGLLYARWWGLFMVELCIHSAYYYRAYAYFGLSVLWIRAVVIIGDIFFQWHVFSLEQE